MPPREAKSRRCSSQIMGLNDKAWEKLFNKYEILKQIETNGEFDFSILIQGGDRFIVKDINKEETMQ